MRSVTVALLLLCAASAISQVTITGISPANGATSVALNTTISLTFSAAMDTNQFSFKNNYFTNVDNVTAQYWSADRQTVSYVAVLQPNTAYFVCVISAHAAGGGVLALPFAAHFTTGASFPSNLYSVSGSVSPGTSGISGSNAIVAFSTTSILGGGGDPTFVDATIADGSGNFTIPYVPAVSGYPIAAKDANSDGDIDPSRGDAIAQGDQLTIAGNVSGVNLVFISFPPLTWTTARDSALAYMNAHVAAPREFRRANAWDIDSVGHATDWEFYFMTTGSSLVSYLRVNQMGMQSDTSSSNWNWAVQGRPIPDVTQAAPADSFIAKIEANGGKAFRLAKPADPALVFRAHLTLGDLEFSQFWQMLPDPNLFYWGGEYNYERQVTQDSSYTVTTHMYLGSFTTGDILAVTGVDETTVAGVPEKFSLEQNYPNPFNPSTTINFGLPVTSRVVLEVYNLIGQRVATLQEGELSAGVHQVSWSPDLPSGVYFYRLEASGSQNASQKYLQVRKMMLLK